MLMGMTGAWHGVVISGLVRNKSKTDLSSLPSGLYLD